MRKYAYLLSLVLIFTIPWEGVLRVPGIGSLSKAIGMGVGVFWLFTVIATNQFRKPGLFQLMVVLFVCWNALSVFWSTDPRTTSAQVWTWIQLLVLVLILWDLYTTKAALFAGLQMYVLGAYVAIGSALANYLAGDSFYTFYQRYSPSDTTNPDGFGITLVLGIPVAWHLAASISSTKMGRLLKLVNYAYIPAAFLGLALSGTRTALIASIPAMLFGLASLTHVRLWARVLIVLFLTSAILIMLPHIQTLRSFQRFSTIPAEITQGDLNNRTNNWREGLDIFVEYPLLGIGSNKYRSVNSLGHLAHNSFLSVLVELGLVGFVLFGIILTTAVIKALIQPKWDARFWLTILFVWAIGASLLAWEDKKTTWLFLSLVTASAALPRPRTETTADSSPMGLYTVTGATMAMLSQDNDFDTGAKVAGLAVTKLEQVDDFCPNETCPDYSKIQSQQQKNLIRFGKTKMGAQRFKCKTCQHTFTKKTSQDTLKLEGFTDWDLCG